MNPQKRTNGNNHYYVDLDRPKPGKRNSYERIPGVTTIVKAGLPKEVFVRYAGSATAEFAVNHWEELNDLPPADRLKRISGGRYEKRDAAATKGKIVHSAAQHLVTGAEVPIPEGLDGYVEAAVKFMDQFDVQPIQDFVELTIFHTAHYYCGTLDLGASVLVPDMADYDWIPRDDDNRARGLFDFKTSASGIYGDIAYQLAPYRFAEFGVTPEGEVISVPEFDFGAGVHLRADGTYSVIPVECGPEQFEDFLTIKRMAEIVEPDNQRALVYSELVPPLGNRFQMVPVGERF
jgi:hypothetical protein